MSVTCDRLVVFSTNKSDRHDIAEILLKVTLNTIKQTKQTYVFIHLTVDLTCDVIFSHVLTFHLSLYNVTFTGYFIVLYERKFHIYFHKIYVHVVLITIIFIWVLFFLNTTKIYSLWSWYKTSSWLKRIEEQNKYHTVGTGHLKIDRRYPNAHMHDR